MLRPVSDPSCAGDSRTETISKLSLVDLAGSERPSKTGAQGTRFEEGKKINLSLHYLALVIKTLSERQGKYVPYRDSKLTHILKDSLGGNSRTTMIAAIAPGEDDRPETISTLRYAKQASLIQNVAEINRNPTARLIEELKKECVRHPSPPHTRTALMHACIAWIGTTHTCLDGETIRPGLAHGACDVESRALCAAVVRRSRSS